MNLLVTGGAGFIGSNFVRWWSARHPGDRVVVLDVLTYAAVPGNIADTGAILVHGDIADQALCENLLRREHVDVIVNFAAESHNSLAVIDPGRFVRTNVLGTQSLLDAARRAGVTRFHHISTCEIYGDLPLNSPARFSEMSPYRPRTPYNASKAAADHIVRAYYATYGLPVTITVSANNYGPYQFPEKVIPLFVSRALDDRPLPVYASSSHRREWLHVLDHCRAIEIVLTDGQVGETYNVGSGHEESVESLADRILSELGKPTTLKTIVPDRPGHDRRYLLDSTKLRTQLGWAPEISFDTGLRETVRWYAEHRAWWEPLGERAPVAEEAWTAQRIAVARSQS